MDQNSKKFCWLFIQADSKGSRWADFAHFSNLYPMLLHKMISSIFASLQVKYLKKPVTFSR